MPTVTSLADTMMMLPPRPPEVEFELMSLFIDAVVVPDAITIAPPSPAFTALELTVPNDVIVPAPAGPVVLVPAKMLITAPLPVSAPVLEALILPALTFPPAKI